MSLGRANSMLIATIGLSVALLIVGGLAVWALLQYNEKATDVDGQINLAVAEAKRVQSEEDYNNYLEREKEPNRDFVGPEDFGRLTFSYPKTWSVYEATSASSGGKYEAYLHPVVVPPIARDTQFALRVTIETKEYDDVVNGYQRAIESGELKSSTFSANGENGVRLDGNFSDDIRGSAVILKIRDKTVTLRTDADTFRADFGKLIATISFNR